MSQSGTARQGERAGDACLAMALISFAVPMPLDYAWFVLLGRFG